VTFFETIYYNYPLRTIKVFLVICSKEFLVFRMTSLRRFRDLLFLLFLSVIVSGGADCSSRPSSELTKEQLEKQKAEDAVYHSDEDRMEAEQNKKARKK